MSCFDFSLKIVRKNIPWKDPSESICSKRRGWRHIRVSFLNGTSLSCLHSSLLLACGHTLQSLCMWFSLTCTLTTVAAHTSSPKLMCIAQRQTGWPVVTQNIVHPGSPQKRWVRTEVPSEWLSLSLFEKVAPKPHNWQAEDYSVKPCKVEEVHFHC